MEALPSYWGKSDNFEPVLDVTNGLGYAAGEPMADPLPTLQHNRTPNASSPIDLISLLGPKRQELYKVIPVTVVYCIIFITGIIGNVSTCIVIARNRYMQTTTNYYLFNLAIADLLVIVLGLPQETYSFWSAYPWIFGETFCVIRTMAAETSTYASILTITAFTVERYVAICHPMRHQTITSLNRAIKVVIVIWVVSGLFSIPIVVQFGLVYQIDSLGKEILESAMCTIKKGRYLEHAFEVSTFLFFLTPMTIITVLYLLIGLAIRRSALSRSGSDSSTHSEQTGTELRAQQQARARRAVLKMLVAVVVAFFICWAPFHAQRLMTIYIKPRHGTPQLYNIQNILFYISGVFYYISSTINPILYNIMSLKFRQAFKSTIFRPCRRRRKRPAFATYKFNNKSPHMDTNLTLVNGYSPKQVDNKNKKTGRCDKTRKTLCGNKTNSSSSGSGMRMLNEDHFEGMELGQVLVEVKSVSCQEQRQQSSFVNLNYRLYHSYA